MKSEPGLAKLQAFCVSEYSDENIAFFRAVQNYKGADNRAGVGPEIIDKYLCKEAEQRVNVPAKILKPFENSSAAGSYEYIATRFDGAEKEIYNLLRTDTFERFTLSKFSPELLSEHPELGLVVEGGPTGAARGVLQSKCNSWKDVVGCDRVLLWVIDRLGMKLYSVASTEQGSSVTSMPMGVGLVGRAARVGGIFFVDDAYETAAFDQTADKASGYVTKAVCSIAIKNLDEEVLGVVQLINKLDGAGGDGGLFTSTDAEAIYDEQEAKVEEAMQVFRSLSQAEWKQAMKR